MKKRKLYSSQMTDEQITKVRETVPELFSGDNANISQFSISVESTDEPETLFHYTSIDTLEKILTESFGREYIILRGTHFEYLNDTKEVKFAIDIMQEIAKEFEDQGKDISKKKLSEHLTSARWKRLTNSFGIKSDLFITSFSENYDSLPMWNMYGNNGNGIAIGCKKSKIKTENNEFSAWGRCYYDKQKVKDSFQMYFPDIYDDITINNGQIRIGPELFLNDLSFHFGILKHKSFDYEREWRFMKQLNLDRQQIKFHSSSGILKPFIENKFPKSDLKKIVIGLCADKDLSEQSVKMLLQNAGFSTNKKDENFIEVIISQAPYRII